MTRKKGFAALITCAMALLLALGFFTPSFSWQNARAEQSAAESGLKIAVLSDTHYFSSDMMGDNEDYNREIKSDRKMLTQSGAILDEALNLIKNDAPDVLIVTGDLTKDGEYQGHVEVAQKLNSFKESEDIEVFVINGNHDVNNANAVDFSSGMAVATRNTTPNNFREIYANLGYNQAIAHYRPEGNKAGGLSYAVRPADGFTILAIDTAKYTLDVTSSGQNSHETGGIITDDLLNWISGQALAARLRGDAVVVMQHHGMVTHYAGQSLLFGDYLVDNYETRAADYADMGIGYVFTGHMHANDIAKTTTQKGNTLYDIQTGSIVTYPSAYRIVEFSRGATSGFFTPISASIQTKYVQSVSYTNLDGQTHTVNNLTEFGRQATKITDEIMFNMLRDIAGGDLGLALSEMMGEGGLAAQLNTALEQMGGSLGMLGVVYNPADPLGSVLEGLLPLMITETTYMDASILGGIEILPGVVIEEFIVTTTYDQTERRLVVDLMGAILDAQPEGTISDQEKQLIKDEFTMYIYMDDLVFMINDAVDQINTLIATEGVVDTLVLEALVEFMTTQAPVAGNPNFEELVNELYQGHLYGNEQMSAQMAEFVSLFSDTAGVEYVIDDVAIPIMVNAINKLLDMVMVNPSELIRSDSQSLSGVFGMMPPTPLGSFMVTMGIDLGQMIGDMMPLVLGLIASNLGYTDLYGELNTLINLGVFTMLIDSGEDLNTTLTFNQKAPTITITFKAEGSADIVREIFYGQTLTDIPAVPEKEGYSGVWESADYTNLTNDLVVNAVYTKIDDDGCGGCGCGSMNVVNGTFLMLGLFALAGATMLIKRKKAGGY